MKWKAHWEFWLETQAQSSQHVTKAEQASNASLKDSLNPPFCLSCPSKLLKLKKKSFRSHFLSCCEWSSRRKEIGKGKERAWGKIWLSPSTTVENGRQSHEEGGLVWSSDGGNRFPFQSRWYLLEEWRQPLFRERPKRTRFPHSKIDRKSVV